MKNIIIAVLLASGSLVAAESVQANKSGTSTGIDGAKFYQKRCSVCHGEKGHKTPMKGMIPIASMEAGALARKVRGYRDQEERHGAYAIYEDSQVMREATYSLSDPQISAIATYISGLK
ncbi:MAG TPA: c-type cytochrome [Candidatus Aenigmarchaeota archaeon]|nr:c-type cytochrome [Candidatus Aenigmarchaeota archaeon]